MTFKTRFPAATLRGLTLFVVSAVAFAALAAQPALGAGPAAKVSDLSWMTGSYEGSMPTGTLEENWSEAKAGSIAALVRSTDGKEATTMIELITIEESDGSLVLRLQQWNPGWVARSEGPQVMNLLSSEPNKVLFEATGEGPLQKLGYSLAGDTFTISITTAQGSFDIPLQKK
ncbi:MAG: DUF6265 family protein [Acidobacteriota bacterium]